MDSNRGRIITLTLLAIAVMAAVGFFAYNAGWEHGAVANARVLAPPAGMAYGVYGGPWHPWGFGFIFPLFFLIFFWFFVMRMLFWGGGRWHHHHCHPMNENAKPQP